MNYEEIFRERGAAYHQAMRQWPEARREEFLRPLAWAPPAAGSRVVDVPAGGGYLQRYLPPGVSWHGHEPCASFLDAAATLDQALLPLPWAPGFADLAMSVAGLHHLADKPALYREFRRVLKPGGRLLLADAFEGGPVAEFLDGFVGRYNSTGHEGDYLNLRSPGEVAACGFRVERAERLSYCWWFDDEEQMGQFCRLLFDMQKLGPAEVAAGIRERLGIRQEGGRVGLNWELYVILGVAGPAGAD